MFASHIKYVLVLVALTTLTYAVPGVRAAVSLPQASVISSNVIAKDNGRSDIKCPTGYSCTPIPYVKGCPKDYICTPLPPKVSINVSSLMYRGTVTSSIQGIKSCTALTPETPCTGKVNQGSQVTLTAIPATSTSFTQWFYGPCDKSTNPVCTYAADTDQSFYAMFGEFQTQSLTVSVTGPGSVWSDGYQISYGADPSGGVGSNTLSAIFQIGSKVTLNAKPWEGYVLSSWGGACSGVATTTCTVIIDDAKTASVTFAKSSL